MVPLYVQYEQNTISSYHSGEQYGDWSAEYDYRSYSRVNATACELDYAPKYIPVDKHLAAIRKLAQENFDDGKKLSEALEERKAK